MADELTGAQQEALEKLIRATRDTGDSLIDWGDNLEKQGNRFTRSVGAAGRGLDKFSMGIRGMTSGDKSLSGMVSSFGSGLNSAVSGVSKLFGPIGQAVGDFAGGALNAVTAIASTAISFAEAMSSTNKGIIDAGLGVRGGLDGIASAAQSANIGVTGFSNALLENVESLRLMAGGAPGGIKAVSKAFQRMGELKLVDDLRALGYSTEEIVGGIAEVGASLNLAGRSYDSEQLAKSTDEYLRAQRELTRLTGMSAKEQKAATESNRRNLFIQNQLSSAGANRPVLEKLVASLGPEFGALALGGMDKTLGLIESQYPTYAAGIKQLVSDVKSGAVSGQEELNARYAELMKDPRIANEIAGVQKTFGQAVGSLYGNLSPAVDMLGGINNTLTQQREAALAGKEALDQSQKNIEGMSGTIASFESLATQLNAGLSMIGVSLFQLAGPMMGSFADKLTGGMQGMQNFATAFKDYNAIMQKGNASEAEKTKATEDFKNRINEIFPGTTKGGMFEGLLGGLKQVLIDGIDGGFEKVLDRLNPFSDIPNMYGDPKKYEEKYKNMFGGGAPQSNNNVTAEPINPPLPSANRIPNNAVGGIYNPTPGGKIIRIAEAGMAEAVMPLERAGSKLGVKVTGELIDDSRTMPAILDKISTNNDTMNLILGTQRAILSAMEENNRLVKLGNNLVS